jgi:hypothetical protein
MDERNCKAPVRIPSDRKRASLHLTLNWDGIEISRSGLRITRRRKVRRRQRAEGRRQRAEGGRQKAEGRRINLILYIYIFLSFFHPSSLIPHPSNF